jgi:hypothetical protein
VQLALVSQHATALKQQLAHQAALNEQLQLELLHQQALILEQQTLREQQVCV